MSSYSILLSYYPRQSTRLDTRTQQQKFYKYLEINLKLKKKTQRQPMFRFTYDSITRQRYIKWHELSFYVYTSGCKTLK